MSSDEFRASRVSRSRAVRAAYVSGAVGKIITVVLGLAAVGIAVRALGATSYGLVATISGVVGLFGFLDFGIGNALIGHAARAHAREDATMMRSVLSNSIAFLCVVGVTIIMIVVPLVFLLPPAALPGAGQVADSQIRFSILILVISVALAGPASLGSRLALAFQRGRQNSIVSIIAAIVSLLGAIAGAYLHYPVAYFVGVFLLAPIFANAAQSFLFISRNRETLRPSMQFVRVKSIARMIPEGLPFTVLVVAGAVSYQTDVLVLAFVIGVASVAAYGLLLRGFNAVTTVLGGGVQQLWASTAHAIEMGDHEWVRSTFTRALVLSGSGYAVISLFAIFFGPGLILMWSGGKVSAPLSLIVAFAIWNTYNFLMSQCSALLNGAGIVRPQAIAASIMALINVPVSLLLTHWWGVTGPLYGSLFSHLLTVGTPTVILIRRFLRKIDTVSSN